MSCGAAESGSVSQRPALSGRERLIMQPSAAESGRVRQSAAECGRVRQSAAGRQRGAESGRERNANRCLRSSFAQGAADCGRKGKAESGRERLRQSVLGLRRKGRTHKKKLRLCNIYNTEKDLKNC
jgi:hypothetical protein